MDGMDQYRAILENLDDGVYFVDLDRQITFWNKGAERISGFSSAEVIYRHCYDNILIHTNDIGTHLCIHGCPLHKSIQNNEMNFASVYLHHKDGYRVPVSVKTIPIVENGVVLGAVEVFQIQQDRFEHLYNIEELKKLALTDQLTSLPNRRYTETYLESKIREYYALGIRFGVLFLDIDNFKLFNDRFGHAVGDDVLRLLAQTYTANLRNSDFMGRWGGEELLAVCVCTDEASLAQVAEKIRILTEKTLLNADGEMLNVTVSIGATLYRPEDTADKVIQRADALLYESKVNGRNKVTLG